MLVVRDMKTNDSEQVAAIHLKSWQKAYQHLLSSHYLNNIDVAKIAQNWKVGLEINSDVVRLVAEQKSQLWGYAAGLENRWSDLFPEVPGELWALYVHPECWQQKVGSTLLAAFKERMKKRGWKRFLVWVLEENSQARKFYEKRGGKIQPHKKNINLGGKDLNEVCYLFEL